VHALFRECRNFHAMVFGEKLEDPMESKCFACGSKLKISTGAANRQKNAKMKAIYKQKTNTQHAKKSRSFS
jgi:hypothetical protein